MNKMIWELFNEFHILSSVLHEILLKKVVEIISKMKQSRGEYLTSSNSLGSEPHK